MSQEGVCDYLVPRLEPGMGDDPCETQCDKPSGHCGPHSFKIDGVRWEWSEATDCGCADCCSQDPSDRCFDFGRV